MADDGTFKDHINSIHSKATKRINWILRSFNNRTHQFMRFVWRTYILPIIDYSSQLWAPQEGVLLTKLEDLQKSFTKRVEGLRNKDYWERLKILKLQSIHRRIERYKLCYTWKIIQGIVPNCGMKWDSNPRRGRRVVIPKYGQYAKKMRENSFILSAGKLFNSLPRELRDDSVSTFPV